MNREITVQQHWPDTGENETILVKDGFKFLINHVHVEREISTPGLNVSVLRIDSLDIHCAM